MFETLIEGEISAIINSNWRKATIFFKTAIQKELLSIKENTISKEEALTLVEMEIEVNNENSKLGREE